MWWGFCTLSYLENQRWTAHCGQWTYSKMFSLNEPTFNLHDLDYDSCQHQPIKSFLNIAKNESPPIMKSLNQKTISPTIPGGPLVLLRSTVPVVSLEEILMDVLLMPLMGREIIVLAEGLVTDQGLKTTHSEMLLPLNGRLGLLLRQGGGLMLTMVEDTPTGCARFLKEGDHS